MQRGGERPRAEGCPAGIAHRADAHAERRPRLRAQRSDAQAGGTQKKEEPPHAYKLALRGGCGERDPGQKKRRGAACCAPTTPPECSGVALRPVNTRLARACRSLRWLRRVRRAAGRWRSG